MTDIPPPPPSNPNPGGDQPGGGMQPTYGAPQAGYGQTQMPGYQGMNTPAPKEKPGAVATAQKLMYAGAAIAVINIIAAFLLTDQLKEQILDSNPLLTDDELNVAIAFGLVFTVIAGLVGVGLWILMAWANGRGFGWARILATIFFGISVLGLIYTMVAGVGVERLLNIASFLVGAAAIYFLWAGKGSKEYFQASR